MAHFSISWRMPRTSNSLVSIKQNEGETLRNFMVRFNAITLEVKDLNEDMAILAMKRGLRGSRFTYSLDKNHPWTYAELLECVYKHIHVGEATSNWRQAEGKDQKERVRRKVELLLNQVDSWLIRELRHPNGVQGRIDTAQNITPTLHWRLLAYRFWWKSKEQNTFDTPHR